MLNNFWQDLRYSARLLIKKPGFTAVAALTLALGVGANTAIFSVVNAALLKPLPFDNSEQIMRLWSTNTEQNLNDLVVSVPDYLDWQKQNQSFEQVAAYSFTSFILTGSGEPERIRGAKVSASLFPLLRVQPISGRPFIPDEDHVGGERVAIVSHGLWQRRFANDPRVIDQQLRLNNSSYRVIGIMPPGFNFPTRRAGGTDIWVPHAFDPGHSMSKRSSSYLSVVGRLKEGVTRAQAQAEMDGVARGLAEQYPATNRQRGVYLMPLQEQLVQKSRPMLLILFAAVSLVLLVACFNVANLLLARASSRSKEMVIRGSLGASRLRLIRQSLTESVLLSLLGGGLGLLFASWGVSLLVALIPPELSQINKIELDLNVLGWSFAVAFLTGLLYGLTPALRLSQPDFTLLKESGKAATAGPGRGRLRNILVVGEIALSLVLLIGASLLIKSLWRLQHVETGFVAENVLTLTLSLPTFKYPDQDKQRAFHARVLERLKALPGVTSSGMTSILPLSGIAEVSDFQVVGKDLGKGGPPLNSRAISSDYLRAIGIPLLRGRPLAESDDQNAPPVCLINNLMARQAFAGEDPIGQRIRIAGAEREIVGIVSDVKHGTLDGEADYEMYVPYTQYPFVSNMTYALRAEASPSSLTSLVRAVVRDIDPDQTIDNMQTMDQVLLKSIAQPRFNTFLLSVFAGTALLITCVGLYGVLSYSVSQRTQEIGIRMALGAQKHNVLMLVVGQGMLLVLLGIVVGLGGAFAASRVLASLLFEVSTTDPLIFSAAPLLLMLVSLIACYVPARYAIKVDPINALRYE